MQIAVTADEMNTLWPIFCLDAVADGGTVDAAEVGR
jgi:hypothetical protein